VITPANYKDDPECNLAFRKFLLSSSQALSQSWGELYIDDYSLFAPVTNKEDDDMAEYMQRTDVRKALHVEEAPTGSWPDGDIGFNYSMEYAACNYGAEEGALSMIDFYRDIAPRLLVTWVCKYMFACSHAHMRTCSLVHLFTTDNGDTDPCVSYEGTVMAVKRVGFEEVDGGGYRPWFYNQAKASLEILAEKAPLFGPNLLAQPMGAQLGGEVVNYEHGLSFLTVHGSGHMVPQFRPQAALHMLDRLVSFQDLSPLMPSNATLMELSPEEFSKTMNKWTDEAMSSPYVDGVAGDDHATAEEAED
jgi:serine carboxypeptidase-like clade 1